MVIGNFQEDCAINTFYGIKISQLAVYSIINKAEDDFANVWIHYNKQTNVEDIKVTLYDEFGKQIKTYSKKKKSDYSNTSSFGLNVDNRFLLLILAQFTYPYTIQKEYFTEKNSVFIIDFYPNFDYISQLKKMS